MGIMGAVPVSGALCGSERRSQMTDSEMLEKRCRAWEKTRQRGQFRYTIIRGVALGCLWFFMNAFFNAFRIHKASYEGMAFVSVFFFLMGCYEAPQSWKRAESRYESDKQYLEVVGRQDAKTIT
jgi:hypothetical protein